MGRLTQIWFERSKIYSRNEYRAGFWSDHRVRTAVLAETWREASTHPRTSLLIKSVDDIPSLDFERARRVGAILARSETSAVVDGSVVEVALARLPSMIVTSDPEDISRLLQSEDVAFARFGAAGSKQADVIVLTI